MRALETWEGRGAGKGRGPGEGRGAGWVRGSRRTRFNSTPLIRFPMLRYVVRERVVRIRCAQQRLPKGVRTLHCMRERRCMRCGVGRGPPGCSTTPSESARLGSTCPSGYPGRYGPAGQCLDGKFWSRTGPGRAAAQAVSRSGYEAAAVAASGACTRRPVARRDGPSAAPWDTPRAGRALT